MDEAHSSQSGESTKSLKAVLSSRSLEEASLEEAEADEARAQTPEEELDEKVSGRDREAGASCPTFRPSPSPRRPSPRPSSSSAPSWQTASFAPFHLYSMRQAIEEGFILDVLASYTTYTSYWRLLKKIEADPRYEKKKAEYLLKAFVDLSEHAIKAKLRVMVEHFAARPKARSAARPRP